MESQAPSSMESSPAAASQPECTMHGGIKGLDCVQLKKNLHYDNSTLIDDIIK